MQKIKRFRKVINSYNNQGRKEAAVDKVNIKINLDVCVTWAFNVDSPSSRAKYLQIRPPRLEFMNRSNCVNVNYKVP